MGQMFAGSKKVCTFAPVKQRGRVAQLNRVADYGSAGYRFESCRGHKKDYLKRWSFLCLRSALAYMGTMLKRSQYFNASAAKR